MHVLARSINEQKFLYNMTSLNYTFQKKEWIELLFSEFRTASEEIIIIRKLLKSNLLKINQKDWNTWFNDWNGFEFYTYGDLIEVRNNNSGNRESELPEWILNKLNINLNRYICITRKVNKFFLKSLKLVERESNIPGRIVFDEFTNLSVERSYASFTDINGFTIDDVNHLFSDIGFFKYNPLDALRKFKSRAGILTRMNLLNELNSEDKKFIQDFKNSLLNSQHRNGSWNNNVIETAVNIIKLIEFKIPTDNEMVENATNWLLKYPEPIIYFPGLWMYYTNPSDKYNTWQHISPTGKVDYDKGSRVAQTKAWRTAESSVLNNKEICQMHCDLMLLTPTAFALEALLKCGLEKEKRVKKAISTLIKTYPPYGKWCGCGLNFQTLSPQSIDFNKRFPIPQSNNEHYRLTWYTNPKEILKITANKRNEFEYKNYQFSNKKNVLSKVSKRLDDCTFLIHHALSFHPDYKGSNLETIGALHLNKRQNSIGEWGQSPLHAMFKYLERNTHPLTAFTVLKSIPLLIRKQRENGLWDYHISYDDNISKIYSDYFERFYPSLEDISLTVLLTLKRFNYLNKLLPK